jgi:hypothetical protein
LGLSHEVKRPGGWRDAASGRFSFKHLEVARRWTTVGHASPKPGQFLGAPLFDGQSSAPSSSSIGLFLIGPRMPRGRRTGGDQLRPPSLERVSMPHQQRGLGPTL